MNTFTTSVALASLLGLGAMTPHDGAPASAVVAKQDPMRLLAAPMARASLMSDGQDASHCVRLEDPKDGYSAARLVNGCTFTIEVAWCAEGVDCQNGLSNMRTFGAGDSYRVFGTGDKPRQVYWGACVGRNTLHGSYGSMSYSCSAD